MKKDRVRKKTSRKWELEREHQEWESQNQKKNIKNERKKSPGK